MTEKTDRELLYSAAKACGFVVLDWIDRYGDYYTPDFHGLIIRDGFSDEKEWNPLADDGDALRLAAALELELLIYHGYGEVWADSLCGNHRGVAVFTENRADDYRHAIVRCAASIGESMQ